jgi:hypothetical protein
MFVAARQVLSKSLANLLKSASHANERSTVQRFGNGLKCVALPERKVISVS